MLSMSKADSSFLFNGKANVITLSGTEMKQTEGEWYWYRPTLTYSSYFRYSYNSHSYVRYNTFRYRRQYSWWR
jgi:hypothetical protein